MKNCTLNIFSITSYQQGLVGQIDNNIKDWIEKGFPFGSVKDIKTVNQQHVSEIKKYSVMPLNHLERGKQERVYIPLFNLLYDYLMENKGKDGHPICRRNFSIVHFLIQASGKNEEIGHHVIHYHIAKYLEKFPTLVAWSGEILYPGYRKLLQEIAKEKKIELRETYFVTKKAAEFLNKCSKKIEETIAKDIKRFYKIEHKKVDIDVNELEKYINLWEKEEINLLQENEDYSSLYQFFLADTRLRTQEECLLCEHLITKGSTKFSKQEIEKQITKLKETFVPVLTIETSFQSKQEIKPEHLTNRIVSKALFELCKEEEKQPLVEMKNNIPRKESIKRYSLLQTYREIIKN